MALLIYLETNKLSKYTLEYFLCLSPMALVTGHSSAPMPASVSLDNPLARDLVGMFCMGTIIKTTRYRS